MIRSNSERKSTKSNQELIEPGGRLRNQSNATPFRVSMNSLAIIASLPTTLPGVDRQSNSGPKLLILLFSEISPYRWCACVIYNHCSCFMTDTTWHVMIYSYPLTCYLIYITPCHAITSCMSITCYCFISDYITWLLSITWYDLLIPSTLVFTYL